MGWRRLAMIAPGLVLLASGAAGCGHATEKAAKADSGPTVIPVTVSDLQRQTVERTVEISGTLKGWEEVTIGAKKGGRVLKVLHDMGDRVKEGEPLVELDPVDARLAVQQAESKYLAELVKLGVTREQAETFLERYGINERIFRGDEAEQLIQKVPAVVQARVALEQAEQNLNRQRQINLRGVGTAQDLQTMENDFRTAKAALDNVILSTRTIIANALTARVALDVAEQSLKDMTIRAPVPSSKPKGQDQPATYAISNRQVSEGQMLREGDAVFELTVEDPLRLWVNVPERYSAEVKLDQTVRISALSRPGETFEGKVTRINPSVDPVSRTFQVEARIPNPEGRLRPGGFARGEIITQREDEAVVVPIESVIRFAGVTKIFLVEGNKAHAVEVETGREIGPTVEVIGAGLPTQGQVVTTGQTKLAEGTPVTIRTPGQEEPSEKESTEPSPAKAGL